MCHVKRTAGDFARAQPTYLQQAVLNVLADNICYQVGLAAVTTSIANYMLHDPATAMDTTHLVSTYLGTFVGAVTLTGDGNVLPPSPLCRN